MDKYIHFRDISGFYTDEGEGDTLVLVHGFCEDGSVWNHFSKSLSRNFRVIIPDLPGYRNSSLTNEELTIEWMADFLKAILDKEKVARAIIVGHSMGGYITLAFAEKYPELALKIALFHSHCFADNEEKKKSRQKSVDFIKQHGTTVFVEELYNNLFGQKFLSENKSVVEKLKTVAMGYAAGTITSDLEAMIKRPGREHVLKSFQRPVLFILGKSDKLIPYEKSLEQCAFPKVADVHILENTGHMGMFEEPQKTLEIIAQFANLKIKTTLQT